LLGENLWLYSTENIYDSTPLRIFMTLLHWEYLWLYSTENIYDSTPLRIFMALLHWEYLWLYSTENIYASHKDTDSWFQGQISKCNIYC
jgi:hypothetical protein